MRPCVLVVGGGFAGIGAVRKLADAEVDVVLVEMAPPHERPARIAVRTEKAADG